MSVSVVLVLDDVIEDLQQEGQVSVSVFSRIQEFRRRKELEQIDQLDGRYQRHGSPVGRNVANNCQKARVQRHKLVGAIDNKLVEGDRQQIVVVTAKEGKVCGELFGE